MEVQVSARAGSSMSNSWSAAGRGGSGDAVVGVGLGGTSVGKLSRRQSGHHDPCWHRRGFYRPGADDCVVVSIDDVFVVLLVVVVVLYQGLCRRSLWHNYGTSCTLNIPAGCTVEVMYPTHLSTFSSDTKLSA